MIEVVKIFAVSDIHGHYTILKNALDDAGFDPQCDDHLLICCGDYFDRGTENFQTLRFIDGIKNKVMLRGNHEDMLLEIFRTGHLKPHNYLNGTLQTIIELFGKYSISGDGFIDFGGKTRVLGRMTDFINEMGDYFETEQYVFTHGWLPTKKNGQLHVIRKDWKQATFDEWKNARKNKWIEMYEHCDRLQDKTIICGHVPAFYGTDYVPSVSIENSGIFFGKGVIAIDAGTDTTKKINVLVVEDRLLSS